MAKAARKTTLRVNLNLLYPQGLSQKLPIRFLRWLLAYGRFIVVIVEIVVLTAFAYRFKLDADLAALTGQINEQVPFIQSLSANEALIKQTQQRLSIIKKTYSSDLAWQKIAPKISSKTPLGVKFTSLNIEKTDTGSLRFKANAQTNSVNDIALFLKGLREEPDFKDVNLTNISFEQGQISFSVGGSSN